MTDYTELKRLAEAFLASDDNTDFPGWMAASDAFDNATGPAAVLALLAENDRLLKLLERTVEQHVPLTELEGVPGWSRVVELVEVVAERDQLKAEIEALRRDAERYRHLKFDATDDGSLIERLDCNISIMNWDSAIDAAMGKGDQS